MAQHYANPWSHMAAGLTALAHTRASVIRWGVVILLTAIWIGGGLYYWLARGEDIAQAVYLTLSAVGMWDAYFADDAPRGAIDPMLQLVRFAAIAAPVVGLLFAFSGQLGRSLARIFNLGAANHIVVAGDSPAATRTHALIVRARRLQERLRTAQREHRRSWLGARAKAA